MPAALKSARITFMAGTRSGNTKVSGVTILEDFIARNSFTSSGCNGRGCSLRLLLIATGTT